jgi:hypothetical protein
LLLVRAALEECGSGLPVKSFQESLREALQGIRLFDCITVIQKSNNENAALLIIGFPPMFMRYRQEGLIHNSNLIQIAGNVFLKFRKIIEAGRFSANWRKAHLSKTL